jgi:2-polyprenyl-6-methoxyphenol hydroxylase-like FAD-dependent oxidoreductase
MSLYIRGELAVKMQLDDLGTTNTEFPLPLNISQALTEEFLEECLSKYGISVERPVTATNVIQDASGVTTTLEMPGGKSETVRSKYVVGCDGAHSVVRHAAKNLTFKGAAYPQDFMLCDAHLRDSNIPQDRISLHLGRTGVLGMFPMNDSVVRIFGSKQQVVADTQDEPTLEQFQAFFADMTPPDAGTLHDPIWLTRFRLHHRCVNSYREGRLFVAGDAAHIHSPAGGQGMNTGIQDAINLGWKLAHALALQSQTQPDEAKADALLDTYSAERLPVGLALLRGTDRIFTFFSTTNRFLIPLRNLLVRYVIPLIARIRWLRHNFFLFMSEFGINYRGCSGIVGTATGFRGPVRGGDRLPDGRVLAEDGETGLQRVCVGAAGHLLLFAGVASGAGSKGVLGEDELEAAGERVVKAMKSEVRVHFIAGGGKPGEGAEWYTDPGGALHAQFGFGKPGYVLVRPDGYVAHIGPLAKLDQLLSFLEG